MIIVYIIYQVNDEDSNRLITYTLTGLYGLFSVLAAILLTSDFLTSLYMRFFCALVFYARAALYRPDPVLFIFIIMVCFILIESIIYVNHREKALLFLRIKLTAFQEEQIKNIFNSVPDKVLISSVPIAILTNLLSHCRP